MKKRHGLWAFGFGCVLALMVQKAAAEPLSARETAIAERVDESFDSQLAFLEKIVNMNSDTMNLDGVEAVGNLFVGELRGLGFDARWESMREKTGRAGHVIATRKGKTGLKILMIGHIDTVHPASSPFKQFVRDGDRATGPGVSDMKNGASAMLYALKALAAEEALKPATITVILTGDEEMPGAGVLTSRQPMIEAAKKADVVLSFESGEPGIGVTARRGFTSWTLTVTGKRSHSSRIFSDEVGAGAIFEMARILDGFYNEVRGEPLLTFNPGVLVAGTNVDYNAEATRGEAFGKLNVVAQSATTEGEIRFIDQEQLARARAKMQAVVDRHLPGTDATIEFREGYPAMPPTPANQRLLEQMSAISQAMGGSALAPNDPLVRGAGDISFAAPHVKAALDGLGGLGGGFHTDDEWLDLNDFKAATKRAAILLHRLSQKTAGALIAAPAK